MAPLSPVFHLMSSFFFIPSYHRKTKQKVAIKIIDLEASNEDIKNIGKEINTLAGGHLCPQLCHYYQSCLVGHSVWIIMEFMGGGSVFDKVKCCSLFF